jgi:hypothetical protein
MSVSLGQMSVARETPEIVMFSTLLEVSEKFTELYIGPCSKNGIMRTKQLKFSGYLQVTMPPLQLKVGLPL